MAQQDLEAAGIDAGTKGDEVEPPPGESSTSESSP
jgi:hypothetical protein